MIDSLLEQFAAGDRLALARLLSHVAEGRHRDAIDAWLRAAGTPRRARVVAITGNGGVGKSSLVGRLIEIIRSHDLRLAVLACDPESSLTGGALLGDRVRMPTRPHDDGLLIRSLAVASGQQAIAAHLPRMIELLGAFGFDLVLLETVGAGQGDTAVRNVADVLVVLIQPEAGDDLQWEKAGLLEVADVVVVHKGDLPSAAIVESHVRDLLNLPGCRNVPVVRASALRREGIDTLWEAVACRLPADASNRNA